MNMTSVRLTKETENRLTTLSNLTKRPKSFYIKESLEKYLDDLEDIYIALDRISTKNRTLYSSSEILAKLNNV